MARSGCSGHSEQGGAHRVSEEAEESSPAQAPGPGSCSSWTHSWTPPPSSLQSGKPALRAQPVEHEEKPCTPLGNSWPLSVSLPILLGWRGWATPKTTLKLAWPPSAGSAVWRRPPITRRTADDSSVNSKSRQLCEGTGSVALGPCRCSQLPSAPHFFLVGRGCLGSC